MKQSQTTTTKHTLQSLVQVASHFSQLCAQLRKQNRFATSVLDHVSGNSILGGALKVSLNVRVISGKLKSRVDEGQKQGIEGATVHGSKVEESPESTVAILPVAHVSDRTGNPVPLCIQMKLEADNQNLHS